MTEPHRKLADLYMTTGAVGDVVEPNPWPSLAADLQKTHLPVQQKLDETEQAGFVVDLCTVYYKSGKRRVIWTGDNKPQKDHLEQLVDFLEKLMEANGQWGYIKAQDWFAKGEYAIGIDVNYYPDRSGFSTFLAFHKDTGGNNIFVNLVFDNQTMIEATEWYVDIAEPSKKRKAWQEQLLPESYLKDLEATRAEFRELLAGKQTVVAGGVSPHLYTFVSWVDDLIWHSTPNGNKRVEYSAEHARRAYPLLEDMDNNFEFEDEQLGVKILGAEILGTIAEASGTHLSVWLKSKGMNMPDLGYDLSRQAWGELYSGAEGEDRFHKDAETRNLTPWRITGRYSEANAQDPRLADSVSIDEPPVNLSRLRRANSSDDVQVELAKAREASKGKPRAFIRTWVRILRLDDAELTNFTFDSL
jgi:hypothetical protein